MEKTLILGGTQFIGRNLVNKLITLDKYQITLFNRQQTGIELFPDIKKIKGDRELEGQTQIANRYWDYVIDLSCYYPHALKNVLESLNGNFGKYVLISTCSVYNSKNNEVVLRNEDAEILTCSVEQKNDRSTATYGNRKAECERILKKSGANYVILRPALVYGKYDPTDRLYYWLYQVKQNEQLLLPDGGERLFSITYVNDLVETILNALSLDCSNEIYNVISTPECSIKKIVDCAQDLLQKNRTVVNASSKFLQENKIGQWMDMPLWIAHDFFTFDNQKLSKDFAFELTAFKESLKQTIQYYEQLNWSEPQYGISEKTRQILMTEIA